MSKSKEQLDRLVMARAQLVLQYPFFGALSLRLRLVEDEMEALSPDKRTMYTNGICIGYNPKFVEQLTDEELLGVVAHEVMHCALLHQTRRENRDEPKWNQATDYAINPVLLDSGLTLPSNGLVDENFRGMSAEEIYALLPDQPTKGRGGGDKGKGEDEEPGSNFGAVRDTPRDLQSEQEQEWKMAAKQAAEAAASQGDLPDAIMKLIDKAAQPKLDWKALLRQWVQQVVGKDDYSWKLPNTRYIPHGVFLPRLFSETIPSIVVAIDTSGSISDELFGQFVGEMKSIITECLPEITYVAYADAVVQRVDEWPRGMFDVDEATERAGRGGTDFRPVFDWVEKEEISPACLIYLTDMLGTFPDAPPDYPVLWVKTTEAPAPWGADLFLEP